MATKINDYLTKQIFIEKNIVTFRSLSRQFNIHVNTAKRELSTFYESTRSLDERSFATYLISGEPISQRISTPNETQDRMEIDGENQKEVEEEEDEEEDDSQEVPQIKMTLAGEQDLEVARENYTRITSEHIYSLSPSPVLDVGLLCRPSEAVYVADSKLSLSESAALGRIVGPHVKVGKVIKPSASARSKEIPKRIQATPSISAKSDKNLKPATAKKDDSAGDADRKATPLKPKLSGKIDFSKAKPKTKPEESKEPSVKVKTEVIDNPIEKVEKKQEKPSTKSDGPSTNNFFAPRGTNKKGGKDTFEEKKVNKEERVKAKEPVAKRGLKRKSIIATDTETEQEPPPPSSAAPSSPEGSEDQFEYKVRGNAILSEDEDEPLPKPRVRGKGKVKPGFDFDFDDMPSKSERSLKAMMDIDDDRIEKVARNTKATEDSSESVDEHPDEDVVMADDSDVPYEKPRRQRKPKKVTPIGRNGLKKKRVALSRTVTDAKGYMGWFRALHVIQIPSDVRATVTEDYSEYESVDEEAEEDPPKPKKSVIAKATSKAGEASKVKGKGKDDQTTGSKEPLRKGFKPGLKRSGSSAGSKVTHKGSLMNFFSEKQ
ncbi:DNA polymerase subunit Cdc27-domain-containing protein [Irpex rosettiformis]|uniref:DNA polymerase subunit Cdc27-domain-containing protein n=1 Tax=Irpex rosettiformis TaxID=378272 RepID=A0ACB8UEA1_9APHY|nr:DNA polymerase subunit Cdc27-domain-containing protein [Irpex rosettiformis]